METQTMTEWLPPVRCTPEMKAALKTIAQGGAGRNMSDHIRYALEIYVSAETQKTDDSKPERVPA